MMSRSFLALLLLLVSITRSGRAQLPKLLDDWQNWVLWEEMKHEGKPTVFDDKSRLMPQWYAAAEIKADSAGGSFRFAVESHSNEWLPLPGDAQCWPQDVKIDTVPVPVLNHEGVPCVKLSMGFKGIVEGIFRWGTMPQSVRIPPQIGVLSLQLNGLPVELPVWDAEGRLWLRRTGTEPADKDFLAVKVYRLINDGSPQWLHTQLELSVAGKSREESLGHLLPEGWRLSSVETPVPCAVDDAGKLKAQLRAGKWTLKFAAYRTSPATTIAYAKEAKPLAKEELVGLQHDPAFRLVEISGIPAVDVAQTTYPEAWRQHPVHQWNPTQAFQIEEKMRGMGARKPQGITIRRSFWLDEDGKNMTYQDELSGSGQQTWRLDAAAGHKLGAVKIGGAGQLITKNPANGAEGVEVRDRHLNLQAIGRLERSDHLAATGWQHDAESLESRVNLPPGWRLLAVFGVDWSRGDWLTSWSLFDVFLLLIVTLAVWKTWGWKTAMIGLLGLLLAYHEPGVPRYTWIGLVAVLAAARWVPANSPPLMLRLVNGLKLAALILFALNAVPFITQQIQQAIYPQLEPSRGEWHGPFSNLPEAPVQAQSAQDEGGIRDRTAAAMQSLSTASSRYDQKSTKLDLKSNLLYDTKAKIQTGPAMPQWKWREVSFGWRGPVSADEKISLWLIPCGLERVITLLRIASMLGLVWLLLGKGKELPKWPGGKGRDGNSPRESVLECAGPPALSSVARPAESSRGLEHSKTLPRPLDAPSASLLLATALIFFVLNQTASAQIPPPEILKELRERVLSLRPQDPQRAEVPQVRLKLQGHRLEMEVEIHASEIVAVPLPGKLPSWSPLHVGDVVTLRHEGYLWVLALPGVQTVKVTGLIPAGAEWQWSFLLKPRQVEIAAAGWTVTGMRPNGVPEDQVFFVEQNRSASAEAAYDQKDFFPVVRIERELELGLIWQLRTKVKRLSPAGKAISLNVPLLAAERVMSAGLNASQGRIEVRFGAGDEEVSWESELAPVPELTLKAEASESWVERWNLTASPVWNVRHEGLAPVYEVSQSQLVPVWTPWPGESVKLSVSRPEAVQGATTTIHQARQVTRLGDRQHSTQLTLQVQASLGEDFRVELPADATISSLRVGEKELPVRREEGTVILPVRPGDQEVLIEWKTPGTLAFQMPSDAVTLPVMASNIASIIHMPASRWLLWASGPMRGPAVRFWGLAVAAALLGFVLAKTKYSPLQGYEWALLMLGFMQLPLFIGATVVLWFFVIAWRGSAPTAISSVVGFNILQVILAGASCITLLCMLAVVHQGLLGEPEMFVTGNGSSTTTLQWFQDRTQDGALPRPMVISVSIWVYRGLMLTWALWLASRALRWIPWAARQLSTGQIWKRTGTKRPASTPPPLPQ